jgi:hypothetical protein
MTLSFRFISKFHSLIKNWLHILKLTKISELFPVFVMDEYVQFFLCVPKNTGKERRIMNTKMIILYFN